MFDETFFPTPGKAIDKMVQPLMTEIGGRRYLSGMAFLEPSAGKGDICDHITRYYGVKPDAVYCIEKNPELQMILRGKKYRVIDSDFLTYADRLNFDVILMNPPFDEGVKHLLKAWEVIRNGRIVCLLNAESIRNPYSAERKVLAGLIEAFGEVEYIGAAFKDAERPTNVEVAIVRLQKETQGSSVGFDGAGMDFDKRVDEEQFQANPLAHADILESLVSQYDHAAALLQQQHSLSQQYAYYVKGIIDTRYDDHGKPELSLNEQLTNLKARFWQYVFNKTKLGNATTSNFRAKFQEFTQQTAQLAFSRANIFAVLGLFFENRDAILQECIEGVFNTATGYHEKNVIHTEGWKTNKSWRINSRIIIPNCLYHDARFDHWSLNYNRQDFLNDLDKALGFISGKKFDEIRNLYTVLNERQTQLNRGLIPDYAEPFESEYFKIRSFKKGTLHLDFKDADLLARLNIAAAAGRREVGGGY